MVIETGASSAKAAGEVEQTKTLVGMSKILKSRTIEKKDRTNNVISENLIQGMSKFPKRMLKSLFRI